MVFLHSCVDGAHGSLQLIQTAAAFVAAEIDNNNDEDGQRPTFQILPSHTVDEVLSPELPTILFSKMETKAASEHE